MLIIYSWTPTIGLSCSDCPDPIASPNMTTIYTVTVTDPNTDCSVTSEIEVNVFGISTNKIPKTLTSWNIQPNPVEEHSIMNYELNTTSEVLIELYDVLGQRVAFITNEIQTEGKESNSSFLYSILAFLMKLAYALAAAMSLPILELSGFEADESNNQDSLTVLIVMYALLPCIIKMISSFLLWRNINANKNTNINRSANNVV